MSGAQDKAKGSVPGRSLNERAFLAHVRDNPGVSSAQIAKRIGFSAQTASVLMRTLEADGLVRRGDPVRGKVGKPKVPIFLKPDGVFAVGLRIGRRQSDLLLVDFLGRIRAQRETRYPYPSPGALDDFVQEGLGAFRETLGESVHTRLVGIGVAAPYELWNWLDIVDGPRDEMLAWKDHRFAESFAQFTDLPVYVGNDGSLACVAQKMFGHGAGISDFGYFHMGFFLGGGLVIGGHVHFGPNANAGAFGSIPMGQAAPNGPQLLHNASLYTLNRAIGPNGDAIAHLEHGTVEAKNWTSQTSKALAQGAVAVAAIADVPTILVDGNLPPNALELLVARINAEIATLDTQGIAAPKVLAGNLGRRAGALGAAYLPIAERFLPKGQHAAR